MAEATSLPLKDKYGEIRHGGYVHYRINNYPKKHGSLSEEDTRRKIDLAFKKWEEISSFQFLNVEKENSPRGADPDIEF